MASRKAVVSDSMASQAPDDAWDTWVNAEIYREYVENFPVYRTLSQRLAELSQLSRAKRVLDLGCGTGATAVVCLEKLPLDAEVDCVDASTTMLEAARSSVNDPRARFVRAKAERVAGVVPYGFDRTICNAAFGLFSDPAAVIRAVADVLVPGGLFVFNVPLGQIEGGHIEPGPFQISLAHALNERAGLRPQPPRRFHAANLKHSLRASGFDVEGLSPFRYRARQREFMELMQVPALAVQLAPELGYEECLDVVRRAVHTSDPLLEVEVDWVFFVARRQPRSRCSVSPAMRARNGLPRHRS
jgi:ubiquinone/menaquinone biosynthesis C-methylase UbiE